MNECIICGDPVNPSAPRVSVLTTNEAVAGNRIRPGRVYLCVEDAEFVRRFVHRLGERSREGGIAMIDVPLPQIPKATLR